MSYTVDTVDDVWDRSVKYFWLSIDVDCLLHVVW